MSNVMGLVIVSAMIGITKTLIHVPTSLVFAEYLPAERYELDS